MADDRVRAISIDKDVNPVNGLHQIYAQCDGGAGLYYYTNDLPPLLALESVYKKWGEDMNAQCALHPLPVPQPIGYEHVDKLLVYFQTNAVQLLDGANTDEISYYGLCASQEPVMQSMLAPAGELGQKGSVAAAFQTAEKLCVENAEPEQVAALVPDVIPASLLVR